MITKLQLLIILIVAIIFNITALVFLNPSIPDGPKLVLSDPTITTKDGDADGDGVPNWLENLSDSNFNDPSSFPYKRDLLEAEQIDVNELIYGGPGEFVNEKIKRFIQSGNLDLDGQDRERFTEESVNYFINSVASRKKREPNISINNNIDREVVYEQYLDVIALLGEFERPIEVIVYEVFGKVTAATQTAIRYQNICDRITNRLPAEVPAEAFVQYKKITQRIVSLCEALDVSLTEDSTESFFYAVQLLNLEGFDEANFVEDFEETVIDIGVKILG